MKTCFNSDIGSLYFKKNYFYCFGGSNNSHLLSLLVLVGWVFGRYERGGSGLRSLMLSRQRAGAGIISKDSSLTRLAPGLG